MKTDIEMILSGHGVYCEATLLAAIEVWNAAVEKCAETDKCKAFVVRKNYKEDGTCEKCGIYPWDH